ncbi:hypothetical protein FS837_011189 [Tulasnella sp. UAMH 9824]|nr:hypothetical protein FS837_011189 [Tulasnella sp. UAMH 9824]
MPDNFAEEDDRSKVFDKCLEPIFQLKFWRKEVPIEPEGEVHGGKVDRTYELDGMILIIREDRVEAGTGHDAYMQVVCDYQLFIKKSREQNSPLFKQGAPVFLLCLFGPILLICGGFHDTKSIIVEPLAKACLLFDDLLHNRQEVLARQLFALKNAVDTLSNRCQVDEINSHPAGVPRVYKNYKPEDGPEQSMTFSRPLESCHPRSLLFIAKEQDPAVEKLVKLAHTYGTEVHRLLAKNHFAPVLYGHSSLQGAPTAYVMEFLRPNTDGKSGWVTLWEFFKSKERATRYLKAIETTLGRILTVMEEAGMVHGDLRPNNIMLQVDSDGTPANTREEEGANLRVVDFDWAGKSGSVCYPLQRNLEIEWPGDPGEGITTRHDRDMVKGWWDKQFSLKFQAPDSDMVE